MNTLLQGVKVLEFGPLMAAGSVGMFLADLGAEVIKLEKPGFGDYGRNVGGVVGPNLSVAHIQRNRNKRSLAVELGREDGRELFWRILATADVFIDGSMSGSTDKLGIGYEDQAARNPAIIYCSYSGFGFDGPYARVPTHGTMMNALAASEPHEVGDDGLTHSLATLPVTKTGGEALTAGAVNAALGISAALVRRARTGRGAFIDVAASDAVLRQAWIHLALELNRHLIVNDLGAPKSGNDFTGARMRYYATKDDKIIVFCAVEPKFWENFRRAVGRDDLPPLDDSTQMDYAQGDDGLAHQLQELFKTQELAYWMELATQWDVPIGPAPRTIAEMRQDPHVQARGMLVDIEHPVVGKFVQVASPIHVRGEAIQPDGLAPALGHDTRTILAELGLTDVEVDDLVAQGTVGVP